MVLRVRKKEMKDTGTIMDLLMQCPVGRIGTVRPDGYPMIKPLNFVYLNGDIYFHSALDGEKIENIKRDDRVCFEIDFPLGYVESFSNPCNAGYHYRSVIILGRASIVETREERLSALRALMEKYQPEGGYNDIPEEKLALTAIIRIYIEEITGKEDLP